MEFVRIAFKKIMKYFRRFYFLRLYYNMGNFRKNKKRAAKATKSVDKAQNELMKEMKKKLDEISDTIETKYGMTTNASPVDSYDGGTAASRQAQMIPISIGAQQGLTDLQRIGDQVTFKHLDLNYRLNLPFLRSSEFGPDITSVRVFMFWDNQPSAVSTAGGNVTNPAYWPEVLQSVLNVANTSNADKTQFILSEKNWDTRKRFSIFYDKTHTLSSTSTQYQTPTTTGLGARSSTGIVRFSKSYVSQRIRYVNGGIIPQNRKLYFGFMSDAQNPIPDGTGGQLTSRLPFIDYNIRVLYEDA